MGPSFGAAPKGGRTRELPLLDSVAAELAQAEESTAPLQSAPGI